MCGNCVERDGKVWHVDRSGYLYVKVRMHRMVWEAENGPIPAGCHVHHRNGDKLDNRLANLQLLTHAEHSALHAEEKLGPHRARAVQGSAEARKRNGALRMRRDLTCAGCGSIWHSPASKPGRFCSMLCVDKARSGSFKGESRACARCASQFVALKRVQVFCSKSCNSAAAADRAHTKVSRAVACAACGTSFDTSRSNARFCCRTCALAFHGNNRFREKVSEAAGRL